VTLSGEAFFQVAHDSRHPFRVLTDRLETTVLGTSFTVRAYPEQAEAIVMVRTGRVRVAPSSAPVAAGTQRPAPAAVVLLPNQQVVYSAAAPELRRELVAQPVQLQPQLLTFDERPVAEVLASLQTAYGVPIRYDGAALAGCTVSLAFGQESLFDKLDLLCKTLGASYEREGEQVIFRSRGCQSE
jgi:ferric-dicitrate binding protein FerR (iron transport regulator)